MLGVCDRLPLPATFGTPHCWAGAQRPGTRRGPSVPAIRPLVGDIDAQSICVGVHRHLVAGSPPRLARRAARWRPRCRSGGTLVCSRFRVPPDACPVQEWLAEGWLGPWVAVLVVCVAAARARSVALDARWLRPRVCLFRCPPALASASARRTPTKSLAKVSDGLCAAIGLLGRRGGGGSAVAVPDAPRGPGARHRLCRWQR